MAVILNINNIVKYTRERMNPKFFLLLIFFIVHHSVNKNDVSINSVKPMCYLSACSSVSSCARSLRSVSSRRSAACCSDASARCRPSTRSTYPPACRHCAHRTRVTSHCPLYNYNTSSHGPSREAITTIMQLITKTYTPTDKVKCLKHL